MADNLVVKHGDVTQRVGVEVIRARGVDVEKLIKMLVANAAAEFASTYYYYTILRMHLAGHEDYKEICEEARLEDRAHWGVVVPRTYDMASRILNEEIEHEAWFIELLAHERDGKSIPSGHFRRGEPGHAPYSKNASFYNP